VERCLVTGANGFIGRVLCRRLEGMGVRVHRLVHQEAGPDTIAADLGRDPLLGLDKMRPEVVFHLAGRVHAADDTSSSEAEHVRVTVDGTRDLLAASVKAGVEAFVFFSSCAVMPVGVNASLDESAPPQPSTPYGRAKLAAEKLVLQANSVGGMRTVCLRLPMVYGPGHKGQLPRMIDAIEKGYFPPIPDLGGGRSVVHVDDVVDAALLVAGRPDAAGKVYVVAEPHAYTSREIYEIVLRALGRRPPRWRMPRFVLTGAALTGDLGERITRRRLPFDSDAFEKLWQPARYSAARIENELGFKTTRTFAAAGPALASWRGL
jgi:UDP-glucose 4-epimerase